ncbi:hypothetical protein [Streptomyces sp. NPDC054849]
MTQKLDPGAGWYGEFLRRDPEGVRACLDGAAMPPWDVVESLLRDLAGARGAEFAARETVYAARLRAAAVAAWDRLPGGEEELWTLLTAAAAQRAESEESLRSLTARLGESVGAAETDALTRELSWTQDDVARAAARHEDLAARLQALRAAPTAPTAPWPAPPQPEDALPGVPRQRPAPPPTRPDAPVGWSERPTVRTEAPVERGGEPVTRAEPPVGRADAGGGRAEAPVGRAEVPVGRAEVPVGRAEGRWTRGGRRAGGARYAGAAAPEAAPFMPPPGHPAGDGVPGTGQPAPRGARFGRTQDPAPRAARSGPPRTGPASGPEPALEPAPESLPGPEGMTHGAAPAGTVRAVAAELLALRAQGRSGEAHALLCEAAAWPAERLPALAAELARAGLAADWTTLLWEAASLPPEQLAAAAAALGDAGREADCDALLRQAVARPAAEVADAALALGGSGRIREADALLGAFVRVRTAEEAAGLARHDPQWFAPRLLQAARALPGTRHRDLVHALRVAGIGAP